MLSLCVHGVSQSVPILLLPQGGVYIATRLNDKQKRFCEEYVIDLNAADAYLRAGYKAKNNEVARVCASQLLTNPNIQAYVQNLQSERSRRTEITADDVLKELSLIAFSRIVDVVDIEPGSISIKAPRTWTESALAAVSEVSEVSMGKSTKVSVRMYDKISALKALADHLGINSDFNKSIQTLRKYGLEIYRDESLSWHLKDLSVSPNPSSNSSE